MSDDAQFDRKFAKEMNHLRGKQQTSYVAGLLPHGDDETPPLPVNTVLLEAADERADLSVENLSKKTRLQRAAIRGLTREDVAAKGIGPGTLKRPHIGVLLGHGYRIVYNELRRLDTKAEHEELTATEAQMLERYTNIVTRLAKEEREQAAADRLEDMADAELEALAKELLDNQ